jgi:hypothetical protein
MNIQEIEDKIESQHHHKDFRTLQNIEKTKLYKQLYAEGLLRSNNSYFGYHTLSKTIGEIITDINSKIEEAYQTKDSKDEILCFVDNGDSRSLFLVIWYYPSNISVDDIYKRAQRYNRLGAML